MKTFKVLLLISFATISSSSAELSLKELMSLTRSAGVRLLVPYEGTTGLGSGFIIGRKHVATCLHVVSRKGEIADSNLTSVAIQALLVNGQTIPGRFVSTPEVGRTCDFAVIELSHEIPKEVPILDIAAAPTLEVGDEIVYSGFPYYSVVSQLTFRGMISGFDASTNIWFIQGPINQGNSGGAVLDSKGRVIGIIRQRGAGIEEGLADVAKRIHEMRSGNGSVTSIVRFGGSSGVDPVAALEMLITNLERTISNGSGGAVSSKCFINYLKENPKFIQK